MHGGVRLKEFIWIKRWLLTQLQRVFFELEAERKLHLDNGPYFFQPHDAEKILKA